jgi:hypothetical protein
VIKYAPKVVSAVKTVVSVLGESSIDEDAGATAADDDGEALVGTNGGPMSFYESIIQDGANGI